MATTSVMETKSARRARTTAVPRVMGWLAATTAGVAQRVRTYARLHGTERVTVATAVASSLISTVSVRE